MAISFPTSPALNDTYVYGGRTYIWDGTAWKPQSEASVGAEALTRVEEVDDLRGRKNLILNGDMSIWQAGTGPFGANEYAADMWQFGGSASGSQSTDAPPGFTYSMRHNRASGTAQLYGGVELTAQGDQGAFEPNSQWIISLWVKPNNNSTLSSRIHFSDTAKGANTSSWAAPVDQAVTGGVWQRMYFLYNVGATVPNAANICLSLYFATTGANDTLWTGVQLERAAPGQVEPTDFEHRSPQETLADCQRFYSKSYDTNIAPGTALANQGRSSLYSYGGTTATGNLATGTCIFPVPMASTPTVILYDRQTGVAGTIRSIYPTPTHTVAGCTAHAITNTGYSGFLKSGQIQNANYEACWTADARL